MSWFEALVAENLRRLGVEAAARAAAFAVSNRPVAAALAVWDLSPEWAGRLLRMDGPYRDARDYWREPPAWDAGGTPVPPAVVLEIREYVRKRGHRARKKRACYMHRSRGRDLRAAFAAGEESK